MGVVPAFGSAEVVKGSGEWQSLSSESIKGRWEVVLQRDGGELKGTLSLTGSNVFKQSDVAGTIDGSSIVLGVAREGVKLATFSAKLSEGKVSGEWDSPTAEDHGVWYGELSPWPRVPE
jgi:hypothetical protein